MDVIKLNPLTLMSLNVRGIRDAVKRKAMFLFCKRSEADLILLQETHSSESDITFWIGQWGNGIYCSHCTNHSAGVSVFLHTFRGDILEVVSSDDGRWLTIILI
jgi:exonuclease III